MKPLINLEGKTNKRKRNRRMKEKRRVIQDVQCSKCKKASVR